MKSTKTRECKNGENEPQKTMRAKENGGEQHVRENTTY